MKAHVMCILLAAILASAIKAEGDTDSQPDLKDKNKAAAEAKPHESTQKNTNHDAKHSDSSNKKVKKHKNIVEWLFFKEEDEKNNHQCNPEFIHSYHLYLMTDREENHKNYICPYVKHDCCSFQSQKMVQALWRRISEPRLQRVLTRNLYHIEGILNAMKDILSLFEKNHLPPHAKYSAECLESISELTEYVQQGVVEKFNLMYMMIKKGFNNLYKFKKQFYCAICDKDNVEHIDLTNKLIFFSDDFCTELSKNHKDISWFLNYELKNYFLTIRNYVLCYRDKNYLLVKNLYEFKSNQEMIKTMAQCRDEQDCREYCEGYSFTGLPDMFIGQFEHLAAMKEFLDFNKPDNRGFFDKEEFLNEDEKLQQAKDDEESDRKDESFNNAVKNATEGADASMSKHDFYQQGKALEEVQWDFFKKSFDMHKQRMIRKKMSQIRGKIESEFQAINLKENFLTVQHAKHNLINFMTKIRPDGINPYKRLDLENIYKVNSNLTYFGVEISNTVGELLNLNETNTLKKMVNVTKLMGDDKSSQDSMNQYLESKIFKNMANTKFNMIENPYIEAKDSVSIWKSIIGVFSSIALFVFSF